MAAPQVGKLAWLEPDGGDLVVYSVVTKDLIARVPRKADTQLIGWDRDRLYFRQDGLDQQMSFLTLDDPQTSTRPARPRACRPRTWWTSRPASSCEVRTAS